MRNLLMLAALLLARSVEARSIVDSSLREKGFFVCGSSIDGLNGHYVQSDELQSDPETPVFVREDSDNDERKELQAHEQDHDFRLYRHNGFWLLADVAAWPPTTHFRCDPTKYDVAVGINTVAACSINLPTPPLYGYSSVNAQYAQDRLGLYQTDCAKLLTTTPTPRVEL